MAGDFAGDGHLDLAVANGGSNDVSVLLGNGDGTFQPQVTYAVGNGPDAIVAGDFTGDGHLDLAVACQGNESRYLREPTQVACSAAGQRRRHVPARRSTRRNTARIALVAGDFTGDGHLDLAVADDGDAYANGTV